MQNAALNSKGAEAPKDGIGYVIHRIAIILACAAVFYPGLNPARITTAIHRNVSLFTSSLSYGALVRNIRRALIRGMIPTGIFSMVQAASIVMLIGIILCVIGGCMSAGNNLMRHKGLFFPLIGSLVMGGGLVMFLTAKSQLAAVNAENAPVYLPGGFILYAVLAGVVLLTTIYLMIREKKSGVVLESKMRMEEKYHLFLLFVPILALAFVFSYLPLWGWRYAFFDYRAGGNLTMDNFVGFKWFTILFNNPTTRADFFRVIKNTLAMSGLGILTSWIPMAFAIFLTQVRSKRFRRVVQTFTTVPNFLGWVIVYAIALAIFSTDGFVNNFLNNVMGITANTNYLMSNSHMWIKMLLWGLWKGLGWSAIIYVSSITGIDASLYEAADMDGAGRFAKMWHVTVPCLLPTFFVLLLMSIANILSNGMEQYLVFSNAINSQNLEVLDLYVYNLGIGNGQIPMSTAIGMFKSVISVILLFVANTTSKKLRGESIV